GFAGVGDLARQGERDAADYQRRGNDREQPRLAPARPRPNRTEDPREAGTNGGCRHPVTMPSTPRPGRSRPLEPEPDLADLDDVAVAEWCHFGDRRPVDERAVRAAEILDVPGPAAERQDRVLRRDELVLDDDRVVDVPSDRRDRVEGERAALLGLTAGRGDDDEAAELRAGLPRRGTEV